MASDSGHLMDSQDLKDRLANKRQLTREMFAMPQIQLGTPMLVEVLVDNVVRTCRCTFLGCKRGEFFMLENPKVNGFPISFLNRRKTAVRYITDGNVFGFETEPMRALSTPFSLTFFKYPALVEEVSLRREPRVQMVLPVSRENGVPNEEYLLNLSARGALLQVMEPMEPGDELCLSFLLPNGTPIERLRAAVRRVEWQQDRILVGVAFEAAHAQLAAIQSYIDVVLDRLAPIGEGRP